MLIKAILLFFSNVDVQSLLQDFDNDSDADVVWLVASQLLRLYQSSHQQSVNPVYFALQYFDQRIGCVTFSPFKSASNNLMPLVIDLY